MTGPAEEMKRAEGVLRGLVGHSIDTLAVSSLGSDEAILLGKVVSKLSPMIGNLLEARIIDILREDAPLDFTWKRQDPDFPDAALFDSSGNNTGYGFEVKAWYALSTELTGRFRESQNLLNTKNIKVVIVAWMMSHIVYGTPQVLDVLIVDASEVAHSRDQHYHKPPDYLIVEPRDTTARTSNLQQTNVAGYKWQSTNSKDKAEAQAMVRAAQRDAKQPHSAIEQSLAELLMAKFPYRMDTNFAKVDRIDNVDIERFKASIMSSKARERSLKMWAKLLKDLSSETDSDREAAEKVIASVYDSL